ncbi:acyl-CoA thioesterase [Geminicoccus harenae]|uniref:acyl-CoA thioesterase n=1 Tax=Geminicoccus harenae TaxID=2498453 RepID=UPI00168ABCFB|nr:hotdog domain-containing protein [Geminicoccus harenae]
MADTTHLIDIVFPGDTNHHGTLFGGVGLAHMDKVAFIAATRHAHGPIVTASCDRIDFSAPAHLGEMVEFAGRVVRVGRRSLGIEVTMIAEAVAGGRRLCSRAVFNMVAVANGAASSPLPSLPPMADVPGASPLRMVEMVFPEWTSHYGSLHGGHALAAMSKAAFVCATRRCHKAVVLAAAQHVDFTSQIQIGEIIELAPRIVATGRSSMSVEVELWAKSLLSGERRMCGHGVFVMVAVGDNHRPSPSVAVL